jgi:hypothetical protein
MVERRQLTGDEKGASKTEPHAVMPFRFSLHFFLVVAALGAMLPIILAEPIKTKDAGCDYQDHSGRPGTGA